MEKEKSQSIIDVIGIFLTVLVVAGLTLFILFARYDKALDNPPDINYIEEDLEEVFMTTFVVVYDYEQEQDYLYVKTKANGLTYKVEYVLKADGYWKYSRYIEIKEDDDGSKG